MKKILLFAAALFVAAETCFAQVGIGTSTPDASAILDLTSTNRGLLVPRLTDSSALAATPVPGLIVFFTSTNSFWFYNGSKWRQMETSGVNWLHSGSSLYTADLTDNVGIGLSNPQYKLDVAGNINIMNQKGIFMNGQMFMHNKGSENTVLGISSGGDHFAGGVRNTLIGYSTGMDLSTGSYNTNVGAYAGDYIITGSHNATLGYSAGQNINSGSGNTCMGSMAGNGITTGNNNTMVGYNARPSFGDYTNATAIGYNALVSASNSLILGGTGTDAVNVGIGTATPLNTLHIVSAGNPLRLEGVQASSKDTILVISGNGVVSKRAGFGLAGWMLNGNPGTSPSSNYIGTSDAADLVLKVNNVQTARFQNAGDYIVLGYQAGTANTGAGNTAIGKNAMSSNTNAKDNIAIGESALASQSFNNSGTAWSSNNVAIGNGAMQNNQPGSVFQGIRNTAVGNQSLNSNVKGTENTAIGYHALYSNTNAGYNVAVGKDALYSQSYDNSGFTYSTYNTAIGHSALYNNQPVGSGNGFHNAATGYKALYANTTGSYNVASGSNAMVANTVGSMNTATGFNSLAANTIGYSNTAYGYGALRYNTVAGSNVAIGSNALFAQSFSNGGAVYVTGNVAIGDNAMQNNQPVSAVTGYQNTALGFSAMMNNTVGHSNTAVGNLAMYNNINGNQNTALGLHAFYGGSNYSNSTAIGFDAQVSASNQIKLGDENVTSLVCKAAYVTTTTQSPNVYVDNTGQIMRSTAPSQVMMTPSGGLAVSMTNGSGGDLPKGTIVMASSTSNAFTIATADCEYAIGVLAQDCTAGSTGWIIVSGIAEVLTKDGLTSSAGNWAGVSDVAGRAYFVSGPPGITMHDREIGHCIQTTTSGTSVLAKVVLHFR